MLRLVLLFALVVGLVLYGRVQLRPRTARERPPWRTIAALFVVGIVVSGLDMTFEHPTSTALLWVSGSLAVGLVIGAVRGRTTRIWTDGAERGPLRRGDAVYLAVWVIGVSIHLSMDVVTPAADRGFLSVASILVWVAAVLATQESIVSARVRRMTTTI